MSELTTDRLMQDARVVRKRLEAAGQDMDLAARETAHQVDARVREHPWTAIGVAAGVALIAGFLLGRK